MAPKRNRSANKKAAADKPVRAPGDNEKGEVARKARPRGSHKEELQNTPAAGAKRGRKELQSTADDHCQASGQASVSGNTGKGSSKRLSSSREPSDKRKTDQRPDHTHGEGKGVDITTASGKHEKSDKGAAYAASTMSPKSKLSSSALEPNVSMSQNIDAAGSLETASEKEMKAPDFSLGAVERGERSSKSATTDTSQGADCSGAGSGLCALKGTGSLIGSEGTPGLSQQSLDTYVPPQEDVDLWGKASRDGYLELELAFAPHKVLLEDKVDEDYNHRKVAFWKSTAGDDTSEIQDCVLDTLDVLLAQMICKRKHLDREVRVRLCTMRMWVARGLYVRQFTSVLVDGAANACAGADGGADDAVEEVKAVVLDGINQLSNHDVANAPKHTNSIDPAVQRAALEQLLQPLQRLKLALKQGASAGASEHAAGSARSKGAAQQAALSQGVLDPNRFHTQVVGNQLIINNITSICNCEGMEQMLLSPLQGSAVVGFGAHHRIVVCPDAASAERANKMICETVRAYRKTSAGNQGSGGSTRSSAVEAANTWPALGGGGGKADLMQLLSRGAAQCMPKSASQPLPLDQELVDHVRGGPKANARAGGKGSKSGQVADIASLDIASLGEHPTMRILGQHLPGLHLPHRCLDHFMVVTATGSLVPPDALVSSSGCPLLLIGEVISEENEAEDLMSHLLRRPALVSTTDVGDENASDEGSEATWPAAIRRALAMVPAIGTSNAAGVTAAAVLSETPPTGVPSGNAFAAMGTNAIAQMLQANAAQANAALTLAANKAQVGGTGVQHTAASTAASPSLNNLLPLNRAAPGQGAMSHFAQVLHQHQHQIQLQHQLQHLGAFGGVAGLLAQLQHQHQHQQQHQQLQQMLQGNVATGLTGGFSGTVAGNLQMQHMEHQLHMLQQFQQLQQQHQQHQQQQQQQHQHIQVQQALQQEAQKLERQASLNSSISHNFQQAILGGMGSLGALGPQTPSSLLSAHTASSLGAPPATAHVGLNVGIPAQTAALALAGGTLAQQHVLAAHSAAPNQGMNGDAACGDAACIPQLDGAHDSETYMHSHDAMAQCGATATNCAAESDHKNKAESDDYRRPRLPAMGVAIKVLAWFLELDDTLHHSNCKSQEAATLPCGAVLWVLGKSAWYRLKVPHGCYLAIMQCFVDKVRIGDAMCDVVRRSPYLSINKVINEVAQSIGPQEGLQEQVAEMETLEVEDGGAAKPGLLQIHDAAEYLSVCIERVAMINTRIEKSRLVSSLLQEAIDLRAMRLVMQQQPALRGLHLVAASLARAKSAASRVAAAGVWQRYETEDMGVDEGQAHANTQVAAQEAGVDASDTSHVDASDRSQAAHLLEVAKVLCELVSQVELAAMRTEPSGHTRRMLPPALIKNGGAGNKRVHKEVDKKPAASNKGGSAGKLWSNASKPHLANTDHLAAFALFGQLAGGAASSHMPAEAWAKNKKRGAKAKGGTMLDCDGSMPSDWPLSLSAGSSVHDHLICLVSRQVLQEVVAQVDKINSCPPGVSATNPDNLIAWFGKAPEQLMSGNLMSGNLGKVSREYVEDHLQAHAAAAHQDEASVWLSDNTEMQQTCMMLCDFIHKFGVEFFQKLRAEVCASAGSNRRMEWMTPHLLAQAVHTRLPCRLVVRVHMWLLQMLVQADDEPQSLLLTEVTWPEVLREVMLKRLQHKARRMLTEEQDLSAPEINTALITLRMCALAAADEEGGVELEVDVIDVNWIPDAVDAIEPGGFVKPKGWRGGGPSGKPDRLRGVGRLSNGFYVAKLCFKNGTEKVLGSEFATSAQAARAWDHAVIRQYAGNVSSDCLNFHDSFDEVLLLLSQGQVDVQGTAREPLPEVAVTRWDDCAGDVGLRGALAVLHKYFAQEVQTIRALGTRSYERIGAHYRWMALQWLCDEATETDALRALIDQHLVLSKIMYNLEVQEKIAAHRQVIDQMNPDVAEMLGVVKTLMCLDARDYRSVLSSSLDATGVKDADEADINVKSPTARRGTGGRFVAKAAALEMATAAKAAANKPSHTKPAPKATLGKDSRLKDNTVSGKDNRVARDAKDNTVARDGKGVTPGKGAPKAIDTRPSPKGTCLASTDGVSTPKGEGVEMRELDLLLIHHKLLQACYSTGAEVEGDINKVLQSALHKEPAACAKTPQPPLPKYLDTAGSKDGAETYVAETHVAETQVPHAQVLHTQVPHTHPTPPIKTRPTPAAAAAAAARVFLEHLPALKRAEHDNTTAAAEGRPCGVGSRQVSVSAHLDGLTLAPAAASTRAGIQLERGWLGSTLRTKALGRDRLNRQYWWFDWPTGWLAVEACPRHSQALAPEKMPQTVSSTKPPRPSRAKPLASLPSSKDTSRSDTVEQVTTGLARAADTKSVTVTGEWDWKTKQAIHTKQPIQSSIKHLTAHANGTASCLEAEGDAAHLDDSAQLEADGMPEHGMPELHTPALPSQEEHQEEEEQEEQEDGQCKACLGIDSSHSCQAKRPAKNALPPPPPPPPPPALQVGKAQGERERVGGVGGAKRGKVTSKHKPGGGMGVKDLTPYTVGCHLHASQSPFELVQPLVHLDHWVVLKTKEEVDQVERCLDVRSPVDWKLLRRLKAERCKLLLPPMPVPQPGSPDEVQREFFSSEVLGQVAPGGMVVTQMFKELASRMSLVPLTAHMLQLLDLSADVDHLLPALPRYSSKTRHASAHDDLPSASEELDDEVVAQVWRRVFAIETLLFPYALGREWTQEKRNAFRRRLASVRTVSRMALLMHQLSGSALESLGVLAGARFEKPPPDKSKSNAKSKVTVEELRVGDEVAYIRAGHRQHLKEKTEPPRPWEAEALGSLSALPHVTCVVEHISHYKPVPLNVFKARDFADDLVEKDKKGEKEPKSEWCMCVRLRPLSVKRKSGGVWCDTVVDASFHVSVYLHSALPEFLVAKLVFEQTCKLKKGARVKMWFAKESETLRKSASGAVNCNVKSRVPSGGTWYMGAVVNNLYTLDEQPWDCIQVRWDDHDELSLVCPWELEVV